MQEDGVWRTINGAKVFIKDGQSVMDAFVRQKANKQKQDKPSQEEIKKDIIDAVNNGQVFDFSVGYGGTICNRYENGGYTQLYDKGNSPMSRFEIEIVPYLKDQFVVVDDGATKTSRTARFKKYGYEVVGEIKKTEKNISEGIYTDKEKDTDYADKWILMRKKGDRK